MNVERLSGLYFFVCAILILLLFPTLSLGERLNFIGNIVEDVCQVEFSQEKIRVEYYENGQGIYETFPVYKSKMNFQRWFFSDIQWINVKHTLGIITITYR
jgi:hypothetical protein